MQHDDTTLQAAIDAALIETEANLCEFAACPETFPKSWAKESPARLALAKAFLAKLPEAQPTLADDGRILGQVAKEAFIGAPGLTDDWMNAAAQAVASVVLAQAIRRMEAVPVKEIWKTFNRTNSLKEVRARLIAAARSESEQQADSTDLREALKIANESADEQMRYKREAEARAEKAEAALVESEKQFQAKVTELLKTLDRAEKAEAEVELLKKVPLRQKVQQLEREVNHWCDLHAVTYNRAEKAEAELAALKSSQIGILRPLSEAGPVPDGCVRVTGLFYLPERKWLLTTGENPIDTHFADIRIPSTETPAQDVTEKPQDIAEIGCGAIVRHCCGSCIYQATGDGGGWGRFATKQNPRKTDWCAVCQHRAEGLEMPVHRHKWGGFRILPNTMSTPQTRRTDAAWKAAFRSTSIDAESIRDFACTLEREGNAASAEIEAMRTVIKEIHSDLEYLGHAAFCESVMFFPGICTCGKAKAQAKLQPFLKP